MWDHPALRWQRWHAGMDIEAVAHTQVGQDLTVRWRKEAGIAQLDSVQGATWQRVQKGVQTCGKVLRSTQGRHIEGGELKQDRASFVPQSCDAWLHHLLGSIAGM